MREVGNQCMRTQNTGSGEDMMALGELCFWLEGVRAKWKKGSVVESRGQDSRGWGSGD